MGRRRREPDGSASRPLAALRKTGVPDGARAKQTFLASYDIAQTRNVTAQILCGVSVSQSLQRSGRTSRHESRGKTKPAQLLCDALTMFVVGDRVAAGRLKLPAHPALAVETSKLHSLKEKIMDVLLVLIVLLLLFGGGGGLYWGMGMGWGLGPVGLILVAFVVALLLFGYRGRGRG
ncbi:hypothetical protein RQP53_21885 [Paucibacter sp. APW11]|uniref:Uncharacterized protein n=1 Tax=Roseateles aquae TaxID=3077235 RepID=A0ABU3PHA4_9BURK|nr:hypothetical protein [Paucibacter sp. APW11]MDT9001943.1 hypothetical protein [Paucibacter sp. APW11]